MLERTDINSVLMQMREMKSQVQGSAEQGGIGGLPGNNQVQSTERTGFDQILKNAVDSVHETQMEAKKMAVAYEQGDRSIDLPQVMIAAEKASVSFQAMTQVRNRLVTAYEDIMKMPI